MKSQDLLEVSARLQKAAERITDPLDNAEDIYDRFEMTAIAILDSEHENYPKEELSRHLTAYLSAKRCELGLEPFGES